MKSWKSLFVKSDNDEGSSQKNEEFSFPIGNTSAQAGGGQSVSTASFNQAATNEVLTVYEKGIESINMPGYDFFEFYKAISSISSPGEQAYNMAFQMAKSMDSSLSAHKLVADAEFYISKINEVHNQYSLQGQQKINAFDTKRSEEKNKLSSEIQQANQQVTQLRSQLHALESEINQKQLRLNAVDGEYLPQENAVREKLLANDGAKQISINRLNAVKEGIQKFIK
jgi:hypothetical protein